MRTKTLLLVGALVVGLVAGWAAPAQAEHHSRAFRGAVTGTVHFEPTTDPACAIPFRTVSEGTGHATHLGPVTMTSSHCSGNTIAGTMTLTGRHGAVALDYQGDCTPVPPVPAEVTCELGFTVSGGSDRFAGAEGSGTMRAVVHPDLSLPDPLLGTWPARWTWSGRITY